jgi:phosphatidylglycerol:prolipoprotein diacylglycerol transferase
MLDLLAAATREVIHWEDLGLRPGHRPRVLHAALLFAGLPLRHRLGYWHLSKMIKGPGAPMAQRHADDLFFYCTLGIILGGPARLRRVLQARAVHPFHRRRRPISWDLLRLWDGGMSFHGGLIGTTLAIAWVAWRGKLSFIRVCDYIAVNVGFGMLFGRIANFVNGELWGSRADVPWAMILRARDRPRPSACRAIRASSTRRCSKGRW